MKTPELKPCPFCGGEAELLTEEDRYYSHLVVCTKCGVRTMGEHIKAIAVAYWNRRMNNEIHD